MSDPRTPYVWNLSKAKELTHDGRLPIESVGKGAYATFFDALVGMELLVPVTVDELIAAIPKCEHGNHAPHIDGLRSYDDVRQGGQYVWCPGGAALGGTDE